VLLQQVEGVDDVGRGHRLAVLPLDPIADREGNRLVAVAPGPLGGQPGAFLGALQRVDEHERFVDGPGRQADVGQVERVEVTRPCLPGLVVDGQHAPGVLTFPDELPDEDELVPQAAASRTDAMTTPISFRRLIAVALR
jgi:hypothetical protein